MFVREMDGLYVSPEYRTFRPSDSVDSEYLKWLLTSSLFWRRLSTLTRGVGGRRERIRPERFLALDIPLPSIAEQRRVVVRIEQVAAKIEDARRLRQEAVDEASALWKRGARAVLESAGNQGKRSLSELVIVRGGGTPSKRNPSFWKGHIPWVTPKDMKALEINEALDHISEIAVSSSSAKVIDPGAVLIVVRGMILAHTVPSAVLRVPAAINQDMKALIPRDGLAPEFLSNVLWAFNDDVLALVEKSTHDTRKLETARLLNFRINVPTQSEQQRVLDHLADLREHVNSLRSLQRQTAAELDALLPSVLDRAFSGAL